MTEEKIDIPDYATHIGAEKYVRWSKSWKYFYHTLPELKTPEDAAAFLMIAAVEADDETSHYISYNDGHSIQPAAALGQYRAEVAVPGMEIALTRLFNRETHGVKTLSNLAQVANYTPAIWTAKTVIRLIEEISALSWEEKLKTTDNAIRFQPWGFQAVYDTMSVASKFIRKKREEADQAGITARMMELTKSFLENADPEDAKGTIAQNFLYCAEKLASDDEMNRLRDQLMRHVPVKPESEHYPRWVEVFPRLLGPK